MGVIKQTQRRALDPSSGNTSDGELSVGDVDARNAYNNANNIANVNLDTDLATSLSLLNVSLSRRARNSYARGRVPAIPQDTTPRHRKNGKGSTRKSRKYENQLILIQEADEEGDELGEVSIEDFTFQASRTFTRFLNESSMTGLMNSFIDSPDQMIHELELDRTKSHKCSIHHSSSGGSFDPGVAFLRICRKLRNILKQRHLPLGIVDSLEEGLIDFFCAHPSHNSTYELGPLDAYRRGLLHAISQYNNLKSFSIGKKKTEKVVHVQIKPSGQFEPPPVRLVAFIETKLHGPDH